VKNEKGCCFVWLDYLNLQKLLPSLMSKFVVDDTVGPLKGASITSGATASTIGSSSETAPALPSSAAAAAPSDGSTTTSPPPTTATTNRSGGGGGSANNSRHGGGGGGGNNDGRFSRNASSDMLPPLGNTSNNNGGGGPRRSPMKQYNKGQQQQQQLDNRCKMLATRSSSQITYGGAKKVGTYYALKSIHLDRCNNKDFVMELRNEGKRDGEGSMWNALFVVVVFRFLLWSGGQS